MTLGVLPSSGIVNSRIVEYPFVLKELDLEHGKILDVGCCDSYFSVILASLGLETYGIDIREYPVHYQNFTFIRSDIRRTCFPDNYFDRIIAVSTLEHVGLSRYDSDEDFEGDKRAIKEMSRILKPLGKIIITLPYGQPYIMRPWFRVYDKVKLKNILQSLEIEKEEYWIRDKSGRWSHSSEMEARYIGLKARIEKQDAVVLLKLKKEQVQDLPPTDRTYDVKYFEDMNRLDNFPSVIRRDNDVFHMASLETQDMVLDLGCGPGRVSMKAAMLSSFVVGVDITLNAAKITKKRAKSADRVNLNVVRACCSNLPFRDKTFDKILLLDVIEHLPTPQKDLLEVKRVLKPNKFIIITTQPNALEIGQLTLRLLGKLVKRRRPRDPTHSTEYSPITLKRLLISCGFSISRFLTFRNFGTYFGLIFRKPLCYINRAYALDNYFLNSTRLSWITGFGILLKARSEAHKNAGSVRVNP